MTRLARPVFGLAAVVLALAASRAPAQTAPATPSAPRAATPTAPTAAAPAAPSERAQRDADSPIYWIRVLADKPPAAGRPATPRASARATAAASAAVAPAGAGAGPVAPSRTASAGPAPAPARAPDRSAPAETVSLAANDPGDPESTGAPPESIGDAAVSSPLVDSRLPEPAAPAEAPDPGLVMTRSVEPQFAMNVMRRLRRGEVEVRFDVGPEGKVTGASVIRSTNHALESAALEAVRQWQFKPMPRARSAEVSLSFDLDA